MSLMEEKVDQYQEEIVHLSHTLPGVSDAYNKFTGACFEDGELDTRTKHLIALGVAMFANNEACTYYHVQAAKEHGATEREIMEAVSAISAAASGHVLSQGVMRVQDAVPPSLNN